MSLSQLQGYKILKAPSTVSVSENAWINEQLKESLWNIWLPYFSTAVVWIMCFKTVLCKKKKHISPSFHFSVMFSENSKYAIYKSVTLGTRKHAYLFLNLYIVLK